MDENKQVRVDNWGVFFLQRLQLFFNRTDYCDLTLQFQGNVQLKVHRLVLQACTEYFEILERSDRLIDENVILMPDTLQADVVVPIINFMYTGMLEYPPSIYNRLCQAADVMHISVLTKLLDAQKPATPLSSKIEKIIKPKVNVKKVMPKPVVVDHHSPTFITRKLSGWKKKPLTSFSSNSSFSSRSDSINRNSDPLCSDEAKPTRFEWPEDDLELPSLDSMDVSGFGDISYNSKPLLREDEVKHIPVKSEPKKQKETVHEIQLDDKPNHETRNGVEKRKADTVLDKSSPKRIKIVENEKDTIISVIASENSSNFDPTKIVSEILKKYPHLVKKKKNIKLKIVPKPTEKESPKPQSSPEKTVIEKPPLKPVLKKTTVPNPDNVKPVVKENIWTCKDCVSPQGGSLDFPLYYLYRKHMTDVHSVKFDSRICKYCGVAFAKTLKHNYHLFTRHGIKPTGGPVFPSCPQCPYVALTKEALQIHKSKHAGTEIQCSDCKLAFSSSNAMASHLQITGHLAKAKKNNFDCQYCTKMSQSPISLLSHIKSNHEAEGKRDGIVSLDEVDLDEGDELMEETVEEQETLENYTVADSQKNKVKIISDVTVPGSKGKPAENITLDQTKSHVSVPTSIATSLGLLDIVVLDENQQFILHNQGQQPGNTQTEYILPQIDPRNVTAEGLPSNDELVMVLTDQDYKDGHSGITTENSNIVVLYSHPADGQQGQFITSQGNLMVNSETGLLEIRNGAAIATTSANQIVMSAPADNHIETIEMIQREIEGGHDIKPQPFYEEEKPKVLEQPQEPVHYIEQPHVEEQNPQSVQEEVVQESVQMQVDEEVEKSVVEEAVVEHQVPVSNPPTINDTVEEQTTTVTPVEAIEPATNSEHTECVAESEVPKQCPEDSQDTVPMEIDDSLVEESSSLPKNEISTSELQEVEIPQSEMEETVSSSDSTIIESQEQIKEERAEEKVNDEEPKQSSDSEKDVAMEIDERTKECGNEETIEQPVQEEVKDEPQENLDSSIESETVEKSPEYSDVEDHRPAEKEDEKPYSPTDNPVDMEPEAEPAFSEKQDTESLNENSTETANCERDLDNQDGATSTQSSQVIEEDTEDKQSEGTKESTTMSILDDWEDTDSQHSDNRTKSIKRGAQETVHKLMDDWDEEEIEK